jgi:multimeric flavodoxin WrbA
MQSERRRVKEYKRFKMKIVCLLGSPRRKGNSAAIAQRFCETAQRLGAKVDNFVLNKLKFRGCQACMTCKTKLDRCVLEDDLSEVLDAVRGADALVMASPIYFGEVSSQLKGFIDRTFSYLVPDYGTNPNPSRLSPGKQLVFILSQGQPDEKRFADVFPRYAYFFKWFGFDEAYLIRACGVRNQGDVEAREDVMVLAAETAEKVMASHRSR